MVSHYRDLTPVIARGLASHGPVTYYLGRLAAAAGDTAEAVRQFERSRDWCERTGAYPRAELSRANLRALLAPTGRTR